MIQTKTIYHNTEEDYVIKTKEWLKTISKSGVIKGVFTASNFSGISTLVSFEY